MDNFTADKYRIQIEKVRNESSGKGLPIGFGDVDQIWSYEEGRPMIIYGMPRSGKTEVMFEILIQLSVMHGRKHFILSPETGQPEDVYSEIISKYIAKPIRKISTGNKENIYAMSDSEFENAYQWAREHFYVVDPLNDLPNNYDIVDIYKLKEEVESNSGWTFSTIIIDTWLELSPQNGEAIYAQVNRIFKMARTYDEKNKTTTLFTIHANDTKAYFDKGTGKEFYPIPKPQQMSGGSTWFRLGYTVLAVHRPDTEVFTDVKHNESWLIFQKVKPKKLGKGGLAKWFWDWKRNRFYEERDGFKQYANTPSGQIVNGEFIEEFDKDDLRNLDDLF